MNWLAFVHLLGFLCICSRCDSSYGTFDDAEKCLSSTMSLLNLVCNNEPGSSCRCKLLSDNQKQGIEDAVCKDVDECVGEDTICGPDASCKNSMGSYTCTCLHGYQLNEIDIIASAANPCTDIDECRETPDICGQQAVCTNAPGTFHCSCPDGLYPSTGVWWMLGVSFCKDLQEILDEIKPPKGQTKERVFLRNMERQLKENEGKILPEPNVVNIFSACMEVAGVGPRARKINTMGDGEMGCLILNNSKCLVSAMVHPGQSQTRKTMMSSTVDLTLQTVTSESSGAEMLLLSAKGNTMEINLKSLAKKNNGSAAAAFMTLNGMDSLLSHLYFKTENRTEMFSDVITAILPSMNNTNLTEPVNFTIYHKKTLPKSGLVTCVYWEETEIQEGIETETEKTKTMRWSVEGCWVEYSSENYTVCRCSHLSTYALILQTTEPPLDNSFLIWLNRVCAIVGLIFFALAILTFLLCSWNPKINNTARLHLCINLALYNLLILLHDTYAEQELACRFVAGLRHFIAVASFVWMLLEALQLHMLVRKLSKVQVIQRDGLPNLHLYLIGYGVPSVIVGVSAIVYSDGYGSGTIMMCWLSEERNFNWALKGPVLIVIIINFILFCATLWSLRPTLAGMKSDISHSKDIKWIVFKILAQFLVLDLVWILSLYKTIFLINVLFIILSSQQGAFIYIIHCLLNKEVREEYIKWLTRSFNKAGEGGARKDVPSVSENFNKAGGSKG